jgi:hypothetical protein
VGKNVLLLHVVQTGSGAHPTSYPTGTGSSFPAGEPDHSSPASAEVKICGSIHPHLHTPSWRSA